MTTNPSLTRKKWFEEGNGMHAVVKTSAATIVEDTVLQFVLEDTGRSSTYEIG